MALGSAAQVTPVENGRRWYREQVLSVTVQDGRRCEVADPTGACYRVDVLGGRYSAVCETCQQDGRQGSDTCMHVGAVQAFFEMLVEDAEEIYGSM